MAELNSDTDVNERLETHKIQKRNQVKFRHEFKRIGGRAHASGQKRARWVQNKIMQRDGLETPATPAPRAKAGWPRSSRTNKPEVIGLFDVPNDLRKRSLAPKCSHDNRDFTTTRQANKRGIRSAEARGKTI